MTVSFLPFLIGTEVQDADLGDTFWQSLSSI